MVVRRRYRARRPRLTRRVYRVGYGRRRRGYRRRRGAGLWDTLKSAHNFIRSNKIISTVGNALSGVPIIGNVAGTIGRTAATLGYGRRRRVRHRRVGGRRRVGRPRTRMYTLRRTKRVYAGGSLRSLATSAHRFIRDRKLISGALNHFGHPKLAGVASTFGYGRGIQSMGAIRF